MVGGFILHFSKKKVAIIKPIDLKKHINSSERISSCLLHTKQENLIFLKLDEIYYKLVLSQSRIITIIITVMLYVFVLPLILYCSCCIIVVYYLYVKFHTHFTHRLKY